MGLDPTMFDGIHYTMPTKDQFDRYDAALLGWPVWRVRFYRRWYAIVGKVCDTLRSLYDWVLR